MSSDDIGRLTASQRAALRDQLMAQREARAAESTEPAESVALPRTSLYFFANAAEESAPDYFAFVLEASRRADAAGLHAVWIPERHFVDFGGLSPNPAILASAIASVTTSIQVRAGSVAAPLSHPARIAEDWAMVDNISGGRAGISFASGWHPNDFVLSRHPFEERRDVTARTITEVRHLLSGGELPYRRSPDTPPVDVRTRPSAVQGRDFPVWITATGTRATFETAGRQGIGIMTALLGQSLHQLRDNVRAYREAWSQAGHPGSGDVVVMLHTFVSTSRDVATELRPAMHSYLRAFRAQTATETGDETVLLEAAFQDYLKGPSLLGSPEKAAGVLRDVARAGADEVGYLIDFGMPHADVLDALDAAMALTSNGTVVS